jgi:hypothetical protein
VRIDALALRLRPRSPLESADLGVRLCQEAARSVFRCHLAVGVPVMMLALASYEIAVWLPSVVIWWAKPWLDRTILFVLSRAAFGEDTTIAQVWRAQREVWWRQFVFTWTIRRLSLWRSLTQPIYQLEGMSITSGGGRVVQIRQRNMGTAMMVTSAFSLAEAGVWLSFVSLVFWFAPAGQAPDVLRLLSGEETGLVAITLPIALAAAVLFVEPFYVGAGFAMYLNRRAELEAWDIEQEFRRAFAR